jgi:hypothetical protein
MKTTPTRRPSATTYPLTIRWHRPLMWLAIAMGALAVVLVVASLIDPRQVTGAEVWVKPLKFSISVGIYALTLSWLIGTMTRWRRALRVAGTISAIGLAIEMVIIVGVAGFGETSHFNVSTPLHTVLWETMAVSIVAVWAMTFIVCVALFKNPLADRARNLAVRAGLMIAIAGMGLAFLMTIPSPSQITDYQGIVGAHTVGVPDGGPGLPFLGWSTVAGDLRIPHFVGLHGLQALPVFVLLLELAGRRLAPLSNPVVRARLVVVATVVYGATLLVLTLQAVAGQSIVHPAGGILLGGIAVAVFGLTAATLAVVWSPERTRLAGTPPLGPTPPLAPTPTVTAG